VEGVAVDLDDEAVVGPEEVELEAFQRSGPLPPGARSMRERSSRRRDEALSFGLGGGLLDERVLSCADLPQPRGALVRQDGLGTAGEDRSGLGRERGRDRVADEEDAAVKAVEAAAFEAVLDGGRGDAAPDGLFARDHAVLPCGQGSDSLIREGEGGGGASAPIAPHTPPGREGVWIRGRYRPHSSTRVRAEWGCVELRALLVLSLLHRPDGSTARPLTPPPPTPGARPCRSRLEP
jgi:hypothetical protein